MQMHPLSFRANGLSLLVTITLLVASPASAFDILVVNNADSGNGSLRQALQFNASQGGGNTILFSNSVISPIVLTSGELLITTNVTIVGPGPDLLTISGNNSSRIFQITNNATVSISNLTITKGNSSSAFGGGGILLSSGTATIRNCTVSSNNIGGNVAYAGGIMLFSGSLSLTDCTLVGNQAAQRAGGIYVNLGALALMNCTISGNSSLSGGGGIQSDSVGTTTLANCTISANSTGGPGGGIRSLGGVQVRNTIIAGNTASIGPDCYGPFVSGGYNLIGKMNESTGWGAVGDQLGTIASPLNPHLEPLGNYGGPTLTMPPQFYSTALDQGKSFGVTTDQRGRTRPITNDFVTSIPFGGDHADIGSVELGRITLVVSNSNDSGPGSLRQAVMDASGADDDVVTFASSVTNAIALTSGEIVLNKWITIAGPTTRTLTVSGNNANRVFHLTGGNVLLSGLTIANGRAPDGGGVRVDGGTHNIDYCCITSNSTTAGLFGTGGGVMLTSNGTLNLHNSSVTHNQADFSGGGIAHDGSNALVIVSCTIASNRLNYIPDGLFYPRGGGVALVYGSSLVVNSTIASNYSTSTSGGFDNSTFYPGAVYFRNSIVAGNSAANAAPDVLGPFTSFGYNLIGNSSGGTGFTNTGDQLNVNPLFGPLANYGGPTLTMALGFGSPAIDKGQGLRQTDQRGFVRHLDDPTIPNAPDGDGADIGAYEADPRFRIENISRVGNDVGLSLTTMLGKNYRAEYTSNLTSVIWPVFTNNAPGNGHLLWVTNFGGANQPRRFYRSGNALD